MITRDQALELINAHVGNKNIVKHMVALEALMGGMHDKLREMGRGEGELGGTKEEYMLAGLLHDGDYCDEVPMEKQGIQIVDWVKEKGYEVPENVAHAMAAHNWSNTGVEPISLMDWTIFIGDSLTGLIVATCLVLPSRKLADVTVDMVLRRFKEKNFAAGTRRDEIAWCEEKLGLTLEDFVKVSLESMQKISNEIGL